MTLPVRYAAVMHNMPTEPKGDYIYLSRDGTHISESDAEIMRDDLLFSSPEEIKEKCEVHRLKDHYLVAIPFSEVEGEYQARPLIFPIMVATPE